MEDLKVAERATAQTQVAAIRAGATPDAFVPLFADIAARQKAMQEQQKAASESVTRRVTGQGRARQKNAGPNLPAPLKAMEQAWCVLTSEEIEEHVKRNLLLTRIDKVICQKDGAEMIFLPGLFGKAEEEAEPTLYTTCIGMRTQR